jgi:L-serine dehydratase
MNLLDIIGPVMVGPSSSHTAGAVKIGRVCHKLLAEKVVRADIFFHGSFLATGKGHGTDKAVVAGLLGMQILWCDSQCKLGKYKRPLTSHP